MLFFELRRNSKNKTRNAAHKQTTSTTVKPKNTDCLIENNSKKIKLDIFFSFLLHQNNTTSSLVSSFRYCLHRTNAVASKPTF